MAVVVSSAGCGDRSMNELPATTTWQRRAADIFALICLFAAIGTVALVAVPLYRIAANPATATGVVSEKRFDEGNSEGGPETYAFKYTFQVAGRAYGGSVSVDKRAYDEASVGDAVPIQYAVDDPGMNRASYAGVQLWHFEGLLYAVLLFGLFLYLGPWRWLKVWRGEADSALQW